MESNYDELLQVNNEILEELQSVSSYVYQIVDDNAILTANISHLSTCFTWYIIFGSSLILLVLMWWTIKQFLHTPR